MFSCLNVLFCERYSRFLPLLFYAEKDNFLSICYSNRFCDFYKDIFVIDAVKSQSWKSSSLFWDFIMLKTKFHLSKNRFLGFLSRKFWQFFNRVLYQVHRRFSYDSASFNEIVIRKDIPVSRVLNVTVRKPRFLTLTLINSFTFVTDWEIRIRSFFSFDKIIIHHSSFFAAKGGPSQSWISILSYRKQAKYWILSWHYVSY